MAKLTKFTKVASGGRDKGDRTLNGFGALPITQKATVSGTPAATLVAVSPEDGADVQSIRVRQTVATTTAGVTLFFGVAANSSALGSVSVSAAGDYILNKPAAATAAAWNVVAGSAILVSAAASAGAAEIYTTWLQPLADS